MMATVGSDTAPPLRPHPSPPAPPPQRPSPLRPRPLAVTTPSHTGAASLPPLKPPRPDAPDGHRSPRPSPGLRFPYSDVSAPSFSSHLPIPATLRQAHPGHAPASPPRPPTPHLF
ncbi:hypothetical protein ZWY2020_046818 [Hordeum vulgare]|nr:hypothetical protein ZWY2020_046818 [Hordeum vulgare]